MRTSERGFTLIELLVVILIIAILAAIAIPLFLRQREKGWEAQVRSGLRNVVASIESYGVDNGGYGGLNADPQIAVRLGQHGFQMPRWASAPGYFRVDSTATTYCVEVRHNLIPAGNPWQMATYRSGGGAPSPTDDCT